MPRRESMLPREWERNNNQPFDARIVSIHTREMNELDWFDMELPKTEVLILNFSSDKYVLPPFICKMGSLKALVIINNSMSIACLDGFPLSANLANLRSLWLERVHVPELSSSAISLRNLHKMHLVLCKMNIFDRADLEFSNIFPSLSDLTIDHCDDFVRPSTICGITSLNSLSITNCQNILELPKNLSNLQSLETLRLYACPMLKALPVEICDLPCLAYLEISQCTRIESLPEEIGNLKKLEKIDMRECCLRGLPGSVDALESLRHVICDKEASNMWEEVKKAVPGLCIEIAESLFSLEWLNE